MFGRHRRFGIGYSSGLGWRGALTPASSYGHPFQPYMQQFTPQPYTRQNPYYTQSPVSYQQQYQQQYQQPYQQPYQLQSSGQTSLTASHMNCTYFNNGICTLRGTPVPANGQACLSFTPRV